MMGRKLMARRSFVGLGAAVIASIAVCLWAPGVVLAQESADLNGSGFVDANDLMMLQEQWHTDGVIVPSIDPDEVAVSTVQSVTIPEDNKPEIQFALTDGNGDVIPLNKLRRLRFILARIIEDNLQANRSHYQNYILNNEGLPTYTDISAATVTDLGGGSYIAKYKKAINISPADRALTHTLGVQIEYDLDNDGQRSVINPLYNFRPDGQPVTTVRELSMTQTCNKCHNPLAIHGGGRREFGICILCHYPGVVAPDSGDSVDMAHMVHQLHISHNFVGANNVATATDGINAASPNWYFDEEDFFEITYPQDIRNCRTCHTGSTAHPGQAEYHLQVPSRLACGGCHDKVNFETGEGHGDPGFPMTNDNACVSCHDDTTDGFVDSVQTVHRVPYKWAGLPKIIAEILSVENVVAGSTPTVTVKVSQVVDNVTSTFQPGGSNSIAIMMAGPTTDYAFDRRESITTTNSIENPDGSRTYTFAGPIAADATGTYAFELEARGGAVEVPETDESVRPAAINPVVFVAVGGGKQTPVPRRQVIDWNKCLKCHDVLSLHGGNRNQYMSCVLCHRPGGDDEGERTAESMPPESVDFKYMIHKIHSGTQLTKEYTIYGHGGRPVGFNEVTFPGDRRDCESCHLPGTYGTPAPEGALPLVVTQENPPLAEPVINFQPTSSACLACHDSDDAREHAQSFVELNGGTENCAACHGRGEQWGFDKVHFRGL